jgi:integrase
LFPQVTGDQASAAFRRARKAVNIVDFRFHDLRHTAASWLRMQGADIHTVAQLLGHKDLRMAARYQHLSPTFLADTVGRLDAVLGSYVTKTLPLQK